MAGAGSPGVGGGVSPSVAGKGGTAGSQAMSTGGTASGAATAGGAGGVAQAGSPNAGSGGGSVGGGGSDSGGDGNEGGSDPGLVETSCSIEALHFKVSGGANFERTSPSDDECGGGIGGDDNQLVISFFLKPPELENTVLASTISYQVVPGTTGTSTPEILSVLTTGAIWSRDLPDAANPLPCSLSLSKYDKVDDTHWRLAGAVSCSGALYGIGELGSTPLTIEDWSFSVLLDTASEQ
jgi:hypothetical protein